MKKLSTLIFWLSCVLLLCGCSDRDKYIVIHGYAQGGTYSVKLNLKGTGKAPEELKQGIDSILTGIDTSLSGYNRKSLLSRFNAGESICPDEYFREIYARSYEFYRQTEGAVDVAAGPLFDIWGFGFTRDSLPDAATVARVKESCGMARLKAELIDTLSASSLLKEGLKGCPKLNFNAVAQGYSCDKVASYLNSVGVRDMLVNIGGEIYSKGLNPARRRWAVAIDKPIDGNQLAGKETQAILEVPEGEWGIVTSGNYRKFYLKDGRKYAHTVDPRSGYPVFHNLLSATIMTASDATLADALATYCMVIGYEQAVRYIETTPGIEGLLVYDAEGEMRSWSSPGFCVR